MFGFVLAVLAGLAVPYVEVPLARPLARMAERWMTIEPGEVRVLSFALMAIAAGLAAVLLNSSNAFWVALGLILGYLGPRLVAAAREAMDNRRS